MAKLFKASDAQGVVGQHVLFIHGLNGDAYSTWQSPDQPNILWPQWLAEDIESLAVWTIGYDASISRWRGSAMHLPDRAKNILEMVVAEPALKTGNITLIGHSLGGLVIKQRP